MARPIATSAEPSQERKSDRRAEEDAASMASYIADMSSELSQLAAGADLPMVAYFLNLARAEAEIRAREMASGTVIRREK